MMNCLDTYKENKKNGGSTYGLSGDGLLQIDGIYVPYVL